MYTHKKNISTRTSQSREVVQKKNNGVFLEDNRQAVVQRKEHTTPIQFGRGDKYKKTTQDYVDDYYDEEYEDQLYEDDYSDEDETYLDGPDIYTAWDPSTAWNSAIAAQVGDSQDYTVTFQWSVLGYNLRAHVHYIAQHGGYRKVAGHGWISGIDDYEFTTPNAVVVNAPADPTTL